MQQYKDRDPKWIKLDRELLNNYAFTQLCDQFKYHVIGLRLLAAQIGNKIPNDPEWIRGRISASTAVDTKALITAGFIEPYDGEEHCVRNCTDLYTEKRREEESKEEKSIFTIQQVEDSAIQVGLTPTEAKDFFDHYNAQGWKRGNGLPIENLPSQMAIWKKNGHKFNGSEDDKQSDIRKAMEDVANRDRRKNKGIMAVVNTRSDVASSEVLF
jgi:hypothetical protein